MPISSDAIKAKIDLVRSQIGRNVTFYTVVGSYDYVASGFYDPLSYTGYIPTLETTTVLARIHWTNDERITATPGGKFFVGDCTLTIDPSYQALAEKSLSDKAKIVVDGRDVTVVGIDPKGAPEINRIRLICKTTGSKFIP